MLTEPTTKDGRLRVKVFKQKLVWVEKDGKATPIAQMSDRHLRFAIEMVQNGIRSKNWWRSDWLPYLIEERRYRALINQKGVKTCRHRSNPITSGKTGKTKETS